MLKKTLIMLAAALGLSQAGESRASDLGAASSSSDTVVESSQADADPPTTSNRKMLERLKERTTPVLRDDLITHSRHEHDVR